MSWLLIWLGILGFGFLTDLDSQHVFFNFVSPAACVLFVFLGLGKLLGGNGSGGNGGSNDGGFWGGDGLGGGDGGGGD